MDEQSPTSGHVVLDTGRGDGFASLRRPAMPRSERYDLGRSLRFRRTA